MLAQFLQSLIRTVVPLAVAAVVSFALRYGVHLDEGAVAEILGAVVASAYYALVRWVEEHFPQVGILLGAKGAPSYGPAGD